jgi:hypothetical protein
MNTNAPTTINPAAIAQAKDIRPPKPPLDIPNAWLWVWGALIVLALATAIYFAFRYWRKKATAPVPERIIPPHERAHLKLLEALALISQPKPFCTLVSDTVRVYLEERFQFHAPERTTEEFLHELKASNLLLPDQKRSLGDFLSICDMVKFARYEPGTTELEALLQSAIRLIDETEPHPEPAENAIAQPANA